MRDDIIIRQESAKDYKEIVSLVLRSFQEGTNYSDGSDIIALIEEIRMSKYYGTVICSRTEWKDRRAFFVM